LAPQKNNIFRNIFLPKLVARKPPYSCGLRARYWIFAVKLKNYTSLLRIIQVVFEIFVENRPIVTFWYQSGGRLTAISRTL
jgi:hypothetical protein